MKKKTDRSSIIDQKTISAILMLSISILAAISAGCTANDTYPSIDTAETAEFTEITHSFDFLDKKITMTVPVDKSLYEAAQSSDKSAYLSPKTITEGNWSKYYYQSFVTDSALMPLYDSILKEFNKIKTQMHLSDDEYAELIAACVQSVPYSTNEDRPDPKYPIETVYENTGDCDDKSILAAALLLIEGYDAVLIKFDDQEHMGVGIRMPQEQKSLSFSGTGYAYLETTLKSFINWPETDPAESEFKNTKNFEIIHVSDNTPSKYYSSVPEIMTIYNAFIRTENDLQSKRSVIESYQDKMDSIKSETEKISKSLNSLSNNPDEYNRAVNKYNDLADEYNRLSGLVYDMIEDYNRDVDAVTYIRENQHNRPDVLAYVNSQILMQ